MPYIYILYCDTLNLYIFGMKFINFGYKFLLRSK